MMIEVSVWKRKNWSSASSAQMSTQSGSRSFIMPLPTRALMFIAAAIETHADAIIVSSLYGQGELDCRGMREKCDEAGLKDILLYVGGNIVIGKQEFSEVEKRFKAMGFNRAFPPGTDPAVDIEDLKKDLHIED